MASPDKTANATIKVLFVCMGNICRSPSAYAVFAHRLLLDPVLADQVWVDSAGTHDYHVGRPADPRSQAAALARGIDMTHHRARQVCGDDFALYDYILAMDNVNLAALLRDCPPPYRHKIRLFLDFAPQTAVTEVPDPYYGGPHGFEHVLDLIEAASTGLLAEIKASQGSSHR